MAYRKEQPLRVAVGEEFEARPISILERIISWIGKVFLGVVICVIAEYVVLKLFYKDSTDINSTLEKFMNTELVITPQTEDTPLKEQNITEKID